MGVKVAQLAEVDGNAYTRRGTNTACTTIYFLGSWLRLQYYCILGGLDVNHEY